MKEITKKQSTESQNYSVSLVTESIKQAYLEGTSLKKVLDINNYKENDEAIKSQLDQLKTNEDCMALLIKEYSFGRVSIEYFNKQLQEYTIKIKALFPKENEFGYLIEDKNLLDILESAQGHLVSQIKGGPNAVSLSLEHLKKYEFTGLLKSEHQKHIGYLVLKEGSIALAISNETMNELGIVKLCGEDYLKNIWAKSYDLECKISILNRHNPEFIDAIIKNFQKLKVDAAQNKKPIKRKTRFSLAWSDEQEEEKEVFSSEELKMIEDGDLDEEFLTPIDELEDALDDCEDEILKEIEDLEKL